MMQSLLRPLVEPLERRQLLSATIVASTGRLVFGDPVGGAATASQTVTLRNTGNASLSIPAGGVSITGTAASQFHITAGPKTTTTVAPGASVKVSVNFGATKLGPQGAALQVKSNAANAPTLSVTLRGLGTKGLQGANEPSLQWILDTYQIPVRTGDSSPAEGTLDLPPRTPNDEVVAPLFVKAGAGSVSIVPIAVYSGVASPALTLGYYTASPSVARHGLFTVPSADVQTINPRVSGATTFDPGAAKFGLYSTWAAQGNRTVYSEDFRNTFITSANGARRMFRVYPLKNPNGSVVANAYVVGNEEAFNHDYQDAVYIIRNVRPASATSSPSVTPTPTPAPSTGTTILQAEGAALTGTIVARSNGGFTGTGYADFQHASGDSIRFDVTAAAAGKKTLTFRYANGSTVDRPLALRVNGAVVNGRLSFGPTGSWTTWKTVSVTVSLAAGANTITLTTIGAEGANLDSLTVA